MEISLQQSAAAPLAYRQDTQGAVRAAPNETASNAKKAEQVPTPAQFGAVGAVNEARIGTLETVKPVFGGIDRTLKPYDTVMLPYTVSDENSIRRSA
tara:strand:- start:26705 stop:26995 length:291 start_codon:yes stop_codon:yes gene_type:complete